MADPDWNITPTLVPFATGVGVLCQEWARLEEMVAMNLVYMAGVRNIETGMLVFRCFDFRAQLTALKVATVRRVKNRKGSEAIVDCLNYIDNTLRPRRNRYVHDMWFPDAIDGSRPVTRFAYTPKITKPQPHTPSSVQWSDDEAQTIEDLIATVDEVRKHTTYLNQLSNDWQGSHRNPASIRMLEAHAAAPPQRRFAHRQPETQRQ